MRHQDIRIGDRLKLKARNAYGFGPLTVTVQEFLERDGYKVPWVRGYYRHVNAYSGDECLDWGAFKPSDFAGRA